MSKIWSFLHRFNNNSRRFGFFKKIIGDIIFQKWLIVAIMSFVLALILSPQVLVRVPTYVVGSIATNNIKADHEFLVEDTASTEQKRLTAGEEALSVYDYDREMESKRSHAVMDAFITAQKIHHQALREENNETTELSARTAFSEAFGGELTGDEMKFVEKYGYSFAVANDIVRLIEALYKRGHLVNDAFSEGDLKKGILARDINSQQVMEVRDLSTAIYPDDVDTILRNGAENTLSGKDEDYRALCFSLARKMVEPNLTFAKNETEKHRKEMMASVRPVFYKVQKNEMIVREGEKITLTDVNKLNALYTGSDGEWFLNLSIFIGMFLTILILSIVLYLLIRHRLPTVDNTSIDIIFLAAGAVLQLLLIKAGIFICEAMDTAFPFVTGDTCHHALPFTVCAMLVTVLLDRDIGIVFAVFTSILAVFLFENPLSMLIFSFLGTVIAAYYIAHCRQRSAFLKTGLLVGGVNVLSVICLSLISGTFLDMKTVFESAMGLAGGVLSGVIVAGIVPLFEYLFGYITDIRLLEHANLNQPVFQQMVMIAPGTYHHSAIVASMAEAAAESIGANSLLAKVSAYYHDIGKIKKSNYYIENQQNWENKHDHLSPKMSSLVIISHVKDGVELARKYKLGRAITDIIRQHHGTRLVNFFYEKAKKESKSSRNKILESDFRYPGPKPQTKEAGIVLLADVTEATSRSLKNPTPSRIRNLVDEWVKKIVDEGQLDESNLTFRDLSKISENFTRILTGIFHHRIDYAESSDEIPNVIHFNGKKKKNGSSRTKPVAAKGD